MSFNLTWMLLTVMFILQLHVFPADLVAVVTDDETLLQVDVHRRRIRCDLWSLSSLQTASFVLTQKSAANERVQCTAGHSEVTVWAAGRHCQINWRHWIWKGNKQVWGLWNMLLLWSDIWNVKELTQNCDLVISYILVFITTHNCGVTSTVGLLCALQA